MIDGGYPVRGEPPPDRRPHPRADRRRARVRRHDADPRRPPRAPGRGFRPDRGRRAPVQRRGRRGHERARRPRSRPALGGRARRPGDDARARRDALHRRRL
jgi:hypothetical protein